MSDQWIWCPEKFTSKLAFLHKKVTQSPGDQCQHTGPQICSSPALYPCQSYFIADPFNHTSIHSSLVHVLVRAWPWQGMDFLIVNCIKKMIHYHGLYIIKKWLQARSRQHNFNSNGTVKTKNASKDWLGVLLFHLADFQMQPIALVKHAAMAGRELILSHSETINESLYDLFNLRFRWALYLYDV